jgi:hypothetical protein
MPAETKKKNLPPRHNGSFKNISPKRLKSLMRHISFLREGLKLNSIIEEEKVPH